VKAYGVVPVRPVAIFGWGNLPYQEGPNCFRVVNRRRVEAGQQFGHHVGAILVEQRERLS